MKMTIGSKTFKVTLEDNPTVAKLKALLPLTVNMTDLNGNEKYYHLSTPLPADAIRPGTIKNGDIMLYGDNSLVLFYKTFETSYSYTRLGRIDDPSSLAAAVGARNVPVSFELERQQSIEKTPFRLELNNSSIKASSVSKEKQMEITRCGTQPSAKGPTDWFTGTVRIDPLFERSDPARVSGASVTFEPGARTAWHTHPLGQTLIVTSGCGWVQRDGGQVEDIRPGDVVYFPPGEKHWHGAAPTTAMTHIAIQEKLDGKAVDWMEKVTDEQYRK